jgi:hypothetical protein
MTTPTTATVAAPVAATPTAPTLQDLTTQQVSERMSALAAKHDSLKAAVTEYETVKVELNATLTEFQKRLGVTMPVAAKAAKEGTPRAPRAKKEGEGKYPSLKEVVVGILNKNAAGLELKGIVAQVQAMIDAKEYDSNARSLSAVVSQAVNALKQENLISHDRESKKYSPKTAAA